MKTLEEPEDAAARRAVPPVICYPTDTLPKPELSKYASARETAVKVDEVKVLPRDASYITVPKGHFLRISSVEGPQVGDLNLFHAHDIGERFFSGKTRALHGTHVTIGHQLWSNLPYLRPMATITQDTLSWYGADEFGGRVHDVIGTRCDPYTGKLLKGVDYHNCCHSNLTRAVSAATNLSLMEAEAHVHDVLNVFMCTGFTKDTGQYFMKASPVRPGDYLEMIAEIDVLAVLSACPGGDCGSEHTADTAPCHPLLMEVFKPEDRVLQDWQSPQRNSYNRQHRDYE